MSNNTDAVTADTCTKSAKNDDSKYYPSTEDLCFLLERIALWAEMDNKSLKSLKYRAPMDMVGLSQITASAMEVLDWIASFPQGEQFLREKKIIS